MARINIPFFRPKPVTHEGAPAHRIDPEAQLRRLVMACMLWEKNFYVDGKTLAEQIMATIPGVAPERVAAIAIEARHEQKLRHVPLLIVREMARLATHRHLVAATLKEVIQRADELTEFLAIYWMEGRQPLSAQVKKGLAEAFTRFDSYALSKYDRDGAVKLRDVLFLTHARPRDPEQEMLWKKLVDGQLESPDTWEVALSAGAGKRETFERLLMEGKLGALALLRNLRNMDESGVDPMLVYEGLNRIRTGRVLPFRFIAAARAVPKWEPFIEPPMLALAGAEQKLPGRTALLIDVSGSMYWSISAKSDMNRLDAACGLAILLRESAENVEIHTFSNQVVQVPPRRGFALRGAIIQSQPNGGTYLGNAVSALLGKGYDRLIVLTDEQSHDVVPAPVTIPHPYMINLACYRNGVGYGAWTHIDGWSEAVMNFIRSYESDRFETHS